MLRACVSRKRAGKRSQRCLSEPDPQARVSNPPIPHSSAAELMFCLEFAASKVRTTPRESVQRHETRPQLSAALTAPRLRTLHRAEDIGSALKGGVNVCQRQLVNELLGLLLTEFVRNFGR